jgi:hypothetical protein
MLSRSVFASMRLLARDKGAEWAPGNRSRTEIVGHKHIGSGGHFHFSTVTTNTTAGNNGENYG